MFENIHSIDWGNISHSHGTAEEVPARLEALVGQSAKDRDEALSYFWEYMLHQGSRDEASPFVVPFLFEVLENVEPPLQREIIDLLLGLAVGYGESFLPYGYDLEKEEHQYQKKLWRGLFSYADSRSAYYQVHKRADAFVKFLRPETNPETRLSAGYAIAHLAQPLAATHTEVARYIEKESDESQLQGLMLCFGMLGRYADPKPGASVLVEFLTPDCSKTFQVIASIALTTIHGAQTPEDALQTLLAALQQSWTLSSPRTDRWWWNEGDLLGYAALVLRLVGKERRDEIASALCQALTKTEACTFAIPETLLDILFPEPRPASGWKSSEFDDVQRGSLRALLRTQHWRNWMIASRFLPRGQTGDDYRNALRTFVREFTGGQDGSDFGFRAGNVSSWDYQKHWQ